MKQWRARLIFMTGFLVIGTASFVLNSCGGGGGGGGSTPAPTPTPTPTATAVGVVNGSATSATIGAAGGSLSTPDGLIALTIPAGALDSDTEISIQPITNMAHGGIGAAYRLTPDGQTFLTPVTLTFTYTDQDLEGTAVEAFGAAFQTADGFWQLAGDPTIDTTAKTVSVSSSHFSDWSRVQGFQIRPPSKTLKVKKSVGLEVKFCFLPDDELVLLSDCDADVVPLNRVSEWSVNGVLGGSGTTGTVSGSGLTATYTAPATKPSPNVVAVSARVDLGARGKALVVSNITIVEGWTGTTSMSTDGMTVSAQVTWTLESTVDNVDTLRPSGTVSAVVPTCSIAPPSAEILPSDGVLMIDYNVDPPTYHGVGSSVWATTYTCQGADPFAGSVAAAFFGGNSGTLGVEAVGTVSSDGSTIEGSATNGAITFNWSFTQ